MQPHPNHPHLFDLGLGVHAIDTGFHRPRFDAAYLVVEDGRAMFVDTGPNPGVPRLLQALDVLGIAREEVDHVVATHVHLDHAGGLGELIGHLPQATVWVHPRGQRHLVDPSALYAGALQVYGQQEMDRAYGQLKPVPAERIRTTLDGMELRWQGRDLRFIDTPGHARHHHALWDASSRGWFTGDTFGLSYREFDTAHGAWILPTSTPVQFEPDALKISIQRLLDAQPDCVYLTHFGKVQDVARLGRMLLGMLEETVALGRSCARHPQRQQALEQGLADLYRGHLSSHGVSDLDQALKLLELDIVLNAQGMGIWLDREAAA